MRYGILIVSAFSALAQAFYEPQLSINYKHGHYRHVGRIQILYPLAQRSEQLLYSHIVGLLDSQHADEGNFGLGYRLLSTHTITGGYVFYDLRRTSNQNRMHQMTLGAEYLTLNNELRGNIYIPFSTAKLIARQPILNTPSTKNLILAQTEVPLAGFDVEWSHNSIFLPQAKLSTSYFYFYAKDVEHIHGPRVRIDYQITKEISLEGEWSYDKARSWNYFVGARVSFALGSKIQSPVSLAHKMTQMPIRDIDVIIKEHCWNETHSEPAFVISTLEELQKVGSGLEGMTLDANYLLDADIDLSPLHTLFHNQEVRGFTPIGTPGRPFTGRFFGADHTLTGLLIEDKREAQSLGLFGYTQGTEKKPVLIEKVHLIDASIIGTHDSRIGGLAGTIDHTTIRNASSQGHFTGGDRITHVGGLVGYAHKQSFLCNVHSICNIQIGLGAFIPRRSKHTYLLPRAGGLIGELENSRLEQAHSTSSIQGGYGATMGGLVGAAYSCYLAHVYNDSYLIQAGRDFSTDYFSYCLSNKKTTPNISNYKFISLKHDKGKQGIGGLVGYMGNSKLAWASTQGQIQVEIGRAVGGLVGTDEHNNLCDVHSTTSIQAGIIYQLGGLIGASIQSTNLDRAYSQGCIKVKHGGNVGGLVGQLGSSHLRQVYSNNHIKIGGTIQAGGLIGHMVQAAQLEHAYSIGSIRGGDDACIGGLIGVTVRKNFENKVRYLSHAYSTSKIQGSHRTLMGGLVGEIGDADLQQVYFFGTLDGPSSAIRSTFFACQTGIVTNSTQYWLSEPSSIVSADLYPLSLSQWDLYKTKPIIQLTDPNTFPGWFDDNIWIMSDNGPELVWPKEQDALAVLNYINSAQRLQTTRLSLPLEVKVLIFFHTQPHRSLNIGQVSRLLRYAFTLVNTEIQGKVRQLWSKKEFLIYVLKNQCPTTKDQENLS